MPAIKAEVIRQRGPRKGNSSYVRYFKSEADREKSLNNNVNFSNSFFKGIFKGVQEGIERDISKDDPPKFSIFKLIKVLKK